MPVEAAVEGSGLVVVVDGAALGVVDPEVVVGVVGGVLGVVDAGERKGGEGDELGRVDDRRGDVGQGFEVGGAWAASVSETRRRGQRQERTQEGR